MRFEDFRLKLPNSKQQQLQRRIDFLQRHSGLTGQFVLNLHAEHRLDLPAYQDIGNAVMSASVYLTSIRNATVQACRNHTHQGPSIPPPWPTLFGRAVTKENFCNYLARKNYFGSMARANSFVETLIRGSLDSNRRLLGQIDLGEYLMWATFDEENSSKHPFSGFNPRGADTIRARLGLNPDEAGKEMLLFVYRLPDGVIPLFPTIADAYSGNGWLWYFRPASPGATSGHTMPWEAKLKTCPEVVHMPVNGNVLMAKIELVR